MRRLAVVAGAVLVMLAAPGTASADVIFDPADADELAATLAEAYETQRVCYGWQVMVDNVGLQEFSVGSNFGAGQSLDDHASECDTTVEFLANITYTSESSESEDSASHQVSSLPQGPTTADLDSLELISDDGLAGENPDLDVYKAVSALPLLAADAGVADPIEASPAPETEAEAAGGQPTNSPGSDFWRRAGGAIMWSALLILAGGVFGFWALKTSRRATARRRAAEAPEEPGGEMPEYVPAEWYDPKTAGQHNVRPETPPPYTPQPPATQKPAGRRRPTQRPATQPPAAQSPGPQPSATQPPGSQSPTTGPASGKSPTTEPPTTEPPAAGAPESAGKSPTTEPPAAQTSATESAAGKTGTDKSASGKTEPSTTAEPSVTQSPATGPAAGKAEPSPPAEARTEAESPAGGESAGGAKPAGRGAPVEGGERNEDQTPPGGSAGKPASKPETETRPEG